MSVPTSVKGAFQLQEKTSETTVCVRVCVCACVCVHWPVTVPGAME